MAVYYAYFQIGFDGTGFWYYVILGEKIFNGIRFNFNTEFYTRVDTCCAKTTPWAWLGQNWILSFLTHTKNKPTWTNLTNSFHNSFFIQIFSYVPFMLNWILGHKHTYIFYNQYRFCTRFYSTWSYTNFSSNDFSESIPLINHRYTGTLWQKFHNLSIFLPRKHKIVR